MLFKCVENDKATIVNDMSTAIKGRWKFIIFLNYFVSLSILKIKCHHKEKKKKNFNDLMSLGKKPKILPWSAKPYETWPLPNSSAFSHNARPLVHSTSVTLFLVYIHPSSLQGNIISCPKLSKTGFWWELWGWGKPRVDRKIPRWIMKEWGGKRKQFSGQRQNGAGGLGGREKQGWTDGRRRFFKILVSSIKPPLHELMASHSSKVSWFYSVTVCALIRCQHPQWVLILY